MNFIAAWLNAHNGLAKTLVALIVAGAGVVGTLPQAQAFVMLTFKAHPAVGTWILAACALYVTLKSPHSDAGAVAHARAIQAQPDAPTAAQVDAATTK